MKNLCLYTILLFLPGICQAQFVNIPDSNFRNYLQQNFSSAMNGNDLDTTHISVISATTISLDSIQIVDLSGIQYFDNLTTLNCPRNFLQSLPPLPNTLTSLTCSDNLITALSDLPSGLITLNCNGNQLNQLPLLPSGLTTLNCSFNTLNVMPALPTGLLNLNFRGNNFTGMPVLPSGLIALDCGENQIPTLGSLPPTLEELNCSKNPILVLPTLPSSLVKLYCADDSLSSLPTLPANLQYLDCSYNELNSLPSLPSSLLSLLCISTSLDSLPTLPPVLNTLSCGSNNLTSLPMLPTTLVSLDCRENAISELPVLPASLQILNCSVNPLTVQPQLPGNLTYLYWNNIPTQNSLPPLPSTLKQLHANNNILNVNGLPTLPNGLTYLSCYNSSLNSLPVLPPSLTFLNCNNNALQSLPAIPANMQSLQCGSNFITLISALPNSLKILGCENNSNLYCLPKLPSVMTSMSIYGTGILCMPNAITFTDTSGGTYLISTLPLCTPSSGCPVAWNIAGDVHLMVAANCADDLVNPGAPLKNLMVNLSTAGNALESFRINQSGNYSFDVPLNVTYNVDVPTTGLPFQVVCPVTTTQTVTPTTLDSLKDDINFAIECTGVDVAVKSIMGRFRPTIQSTVQISAGELAQYYNVSCNLTAAAEVKIVLGGPVSFVQPAAGALSPTSVIGNVISYSVPSITAVNFSNAFNIEVLTDPAAVIGQMVCVKVEISSPADINTTNNSLTMCFPVLNSYDPNAKEVYPIYSKEAGEEITYTLHFQNTGNDTAYRVVIRDNLSSNLDWSSFSYLNSSHDVEIARKDSWVTFTFNNVNLPGVKQNELLSQGWVMFKIRTRADLPMGTKTENSVGIYFDNNPPIFTNIANHYIGLDTSKFVRVNPIELPTAFTPNQDGLNETWHILNHNYLDQKKIKVERVMVRNRWGQTVFLDNLGNKFSWSPIYQLPMDTYSYVIYYTVNNIDHDVQHGTVELIR